MPGSNDYKEEAVRKGVGVWRARQSRCESCRCCLWLYPQGLPRDCHAPRCDSGLAMTVVKGGCSLPPLWAGLARNCIWLYLTFFFIKKQAPTTFRCDLRCGGERWECETGRRSLWRLKLASRSRVKAANSAKGGESAYPRYDERAGLDPSVLNQESAVRGLGNSRLWPSRSASPHQQP